MPFSCFDYFPADSVRDSRSQFAIVVTVMHNADRILLYVRDRIDRYIRSLARPTVSFMVQSASGTTITVASCWGTVSVVSIGQQWTRVVGYWVLSEQSSGYGSLTLSIDEQQIMWYWILRGNEVITVFLRYRLQTSSDAYAGTCGTQSTSVIYDIIQVRERSEIKPIGYCFNSKLLKLIGRSPYQSFE